MVDEQQAREFVPVLWLARSIARGEPDASPRADGVRAAAISCLLNTPRGDASLALMAHGAAQQPSDAACLLHRLEALLREPGARADRTVTLLMLVDRLARGSDATRQQLRALVLPPAKYGRDVLVSGGVEQPHAADDSLCNLLVARMGAADLGVSHYAGDLLFALCDDDADEFTRCVGFGRAAGLLAMRGLMRTPAATTRADLPVAQRDDETQRLMRQLTAQPADESDDARVVRMGRALHDLEALGVLQTVRQGDAVAVRCSCCNAALAPPLKRCAWCHEATVRSLRGAASPASSASCAQYCNVACQKKDWKQRHKATCAKTAKKK